MGYEDLRYSKTSEFLTDGKPAKESNPVGTGGRVSEWKTVDFFMGNGNPKEGDLVDWRKISKGGLDFSRNPVNKDVLLIPESDTLKIKGGMSLTDFKESFQKATGFLDVISSATEAFTGTTYKPAWNVKTFEDLKQLEIDGELTFKFKFGSAGLYNAFEEVIKPIIALVLLFGVESDLNNGSYDGCLADAANAIKVPYPTQTMFLVEKVKGAFADINNKSKEKVEIGADGLMGNINKANAIIQSALAAGARNVALSSAYNNLYIRWGRLNIGPLVYQDYSYSLKMSELDSNGWPIEGEFTINGISSMRASTTQAMISPFIKGV